MSTSRSPRHPISPPGSGPRLTPARLPRRIPSPMPTSRSLMPMLSRPSAASSRPSSAAAPPSLPLPLLRLLLLLCLLWLQPLPPRCLPPRPREAFLVDLSQGCLQFLLQSQPCRLRLQSLAQTVVAVSRVHLRLFQLPCLAFQPPCRFPLPLRVLLGPVLPLEAHVLSLVSSVDSAAWWTTFSTRRPELWLESSERSTTSCPSQQTCPLPFQMWVAS